MSPEPGLMHYAIRAVTMQYDTVGFYLVSWLASLPALIRCSNKMERKHYQKDTNNKCGGNWNLRCTSVGIISHHYPAVWSRNVHSCYTFVFDAQSFTSKLLSLSNLSSLKFPIIVLKVSCVHLCNKCFWRMFTYFSFSVCHSAAYSFGCFFFF